MFKNIKRYGFIIVMILLISFGVTHADHRSYVWTYEYMTMEPGKAELENYLTFSTPEAGTFKNKTTLESQVEIEVGMSKCFDFAIYQVFSQKPRMGLNYSAFKMRARYKFGEKDKFIFDPLLYAEYKGVPDFSEHELEMKLIMSKDFGKFNISLNPVLTLEYEDEWKTVFGYDLGMSYKVLPLLSFGIEFKGEEDGHYFAPVISHGGHKIWIAAAPTFKLGKVKDGNPEFFFRMIMGVEL
jgi:hypothetical protein